MFSRLVRPASVAQHVARSGGHREFIAAAGRDPDRRWMDWRVVDRVLSSPRPTTGDHADGELQARAVSS